MCGGAGIWYYAGMDTYEFHVAACEMLPDVFAMEGGGVAATPELWRVRRGEIMDLLQRECYGRMPPPPGVAPDVRLITPPVRVIGADGAERSQFLAHPFADSGFGIQFDVYKPAGGDGGKMPAMLCGGAAVVRGCLARRRFSGVRACCTV